MCYTGGINDKETGQLYLNARYYEPEDGRFVTLDTYRGSFDEPDTWHLYTYCVNNPINFIDPSGHALVLAIPLGGAVISGKVVIGATIVTGIIAVGGQVVTYVRDRYKPKKPKKRDKYRVKIAIDRPQKYRGITYGPAIMLARWRDLKGSKWSKLKKFARRRNHNWRYHLHYEIYKNGRKIYRSKGI